MRTRAGRIRSSFVASAAALALLLPAVRAFNFKPRCTATMTVTRPNRITEVLDRVRTIGANTTATFAFKTPRQTVRYPVTVKQLKAPGCAGFSATTRFRVSS